MFQILAQAQPPVGPGGMLLLKVLFGIPAALLVVVIISSALEGIIKVLTGNRK